MKSKALLTIAAIGLFTFAAGAAEIIIPAAGTGAGANSSQWQSDLLLHNIGPRAVTLTATLHIGTDVRGPVAITIPAKNTRQFTDVVDRLFNVESGTGALVLQLTDRDTKFLAVTSRTYNTLGDVEFGQDIPAVRAEHAAAAGSIAVMTNPATSTNDRFNFGIYAVDAATVRWELVRANGTVAGTREVSYADGQHEQYNSGIFSLLNATDSQPGDTVYARILSGKAIVYGSSINETGDPTFVPSTQTSEEVLLNFGIDLDENGTIDISDSDNDGVLDASIDVITSMFPNFFRVVVESEFGDDVTLEVVESQAAAEFRDANGTMRVGAAGDLKNTTGSIVIRATSANGATTLLTIPVRFK
jgi:hypothetical protein